MIDNNKYEHLDSSNFEFVQRDERIYDKKFQTKPIGYFKDAMIRFSKNRTNVIATIILFSLILLSIFVPILTDKNYTKLDTQLGNLPPRMPLIEKLGFFDGYAWYSDQTVDRSTIDPETNLGIPKVTDFDPKLIDFKSLENYVKPCTEMKDVCVGGQTVFAVNSDYTKAQFLSVDYFSLSSATNPVLKVDVESLQGDSAVLYVKLSKNYGTTYDTVATITEKGDYEYNIFDLLGPGAIYSQILLEISGETNKTIIEVNSLKIYDNTQTEPVIEESGFKLASYTIISDNSNQENSGVVENKQQPGRIARSNGELLLAKFRFNEYGRAFGVKEMLAFPASKYDELIAKYADKCTQLPDPNNPKGWLFTEGCPITKVTSITEKVKGPDGNWYFSYNIFMDNAIYSGYEGVPYFLFGTTQGGLDYFALLWLGLRTSLFIGIIVAVINITIGIIYGAIEGYYGGKVDLLMERFGEIIGRIPFLVWLALFVIILGPGIVTLIVLLTVTGWLGIAGVTRAQFYRFKGSEYVLASRTLGAKDSRLIFRHILPNGIGTIITASILMIPGVIFSEATISYLGYGIGYGQSFKLFGFIELSGVSIGVLLNEGRTELVDKSYLTLFPAIIISILMITFNMFGNALRDAFNPSLRGSE